MSIQTKPMSQTAPAAKAETEGPGLLQVFTLVVWITWLLIGVLGWWLSAPKHGAPQPPPKPPPPPVQAELLDVQLADAPMPANDQAANPDQDPPAPQLAAPPALPAVAAFAPTIPFAVPIEGPVRIVAARMANPARVPIVRQPAVRRLTAEAAAKQPRPDYPAEAIRLQQQGTVGIRFTVGEDGGILSAQVIAPSWPALNQTALETVRDQWHFGSGPRRVYDYYFVFRFN